MPASKAQTIYTDVQAAHPSLIFRLTLHAVACGGELG